MQTNTLSHGLELVAQLLLSSWLLLLQKVSVRGGEMIALKPEKHCQRLSCSQLALLYSLVLLPGSHWNRSHLNVRAKLPPLPKLQLLRVHLISHHYLVIANFQKLLLLVVKTYYVKLLHISLMLCSFHPLQVHSSKFGIGILPSRWLLMLSDQVEPGLT